MENLKKGDVVNIFGIGDFMAQTTHTAVKATGQYTADGKPVFTENKEGARKRFTLREFKKDTLVFLGDVPFKTDGETELGGGEGVFTTRMMRGNACLNFTGNPAEIKEWIETKNINKNFTAYDAVIHIDGEKETPLFPEVPTTHAVVLGIREKQTV